MHRLRYLPLALAVCLLLSGTPATAQPAPAAAPTLERLSGSCGEITAGREPEPMTLSASVRRGVVRIRLQNYVFYCAPPPEFRVSVSARLAAGRSTPVTLTGYLVPNVPRASCTCTHQLAYALRGLAPGTYELRVEAGRSRLRSGAAGARRPTYLAVEVVVP